MSNGTDNLGRLIAAERNAVTAINFCKELRETVAKLAARVEQTAAENVQLRQELNSVRAQLYATRGGGPTA